MAFSRWGRGGIYHLDVEQVKALTNVMKKNYPGAHSNTMKKFELTRQAMRRNILGAANNLPEGLAFSPMTGLYSLVVAKATNK